MPSIAVPVAVPVAVFCAVAAFGCDDFFYVCPTADPERVAALPARLSETGLYDDIAADAVSPAAREYRPRFELWSDGADKRRWIMVPDGERIDTSDVDSWQFPIGTRVFKEFSSGGVRVETRLVERLGDGGWAAIAYRWRADGSDADAAALGAIDALGTGHDVPAAGECAGCHGGRRSFVLGYSAIQLGASQIDPDLVTEVPDVGLDIGGGDDDVAALGYLHANCGHCHNSARPGSDEAPCMDPRNPLDFWLQVDQIGSPIDTAAVQSAINTRKIIPGDAGDSPVIERITTRDLFFRMPPLGSEIVDRDAAALLTRWIEGLPP